jgi:hypothetical protein
MPQELADQAARPALASVDVIESPEGGTMDAGVGDRIVVESGNAAQRTLE